MKIESNLIYSFFVSDYTELIFQKTEIGDNSFGDIRLFLHSTKYTGPTQKGLIIKKSLLEELIKVLKKEKFRIIKSDEEREISRLSYKNGSLVVISLRESTVDNNPVCIDIREYIISPRYEGFTKKGVRFSADQLDEFIKGCEMLVNVL